ncbi:MAG: hypothetical protein IJ859_08480 [Synergistaceae bacterium]|nr:hypothetical protein [Synergistaceae bacterium]
MSVIDSRRYGRRSTTSFTREEFEQIRNTPPADHTELRAESARIMERIMKAREQKNAFAQK